jgi:hypothetical protein
VKMDGLQTIANTKHAIPAGSRIMSAARPSPSRCNLAAAAHDRTGGWRVQRGVSRRL